MRWEADFILVTTVTGDHVADPSRWPNARRQVTQQLQIATWLGKPGVDSAHGMEHGGAGTFPFGRAKLTIAHHSSGFLPDGTGASKSLRGFAQSHDGHDVYIAGDTALNHLRQKLIGDVGGADLAILPIGDYHHGPMIATSSGQGQARDSPPLQHLHHCCRCRRLCPPPETREGSTARSWPSANR